MEDIQIGYDEGVLLESESACWFSRDDVALIDLILTNKNIFCVCERDNGFFKKATQETYTFALNDIKIINGKAMTQQIKYEDEWCLQIQFRQSIEYFHFYESPKKVIPQWVQAINDALGIATNDESDARKKKKAGIFSRTTVANTMIETGGTPTRQNSVKVNPIQNVSLGQENGNGIVSRTNLVKESCTSGDAPNFCVNCGNKLGNGAKFCSVCGSKVRLIENEREVAQIHREVSKGNKEDEQESSTNINYTENSKSRRQQEYVGKVFKCPNCGNVVNQSDTICDNCGYHLSGKEAIASAQDFERKLLETEMSRKSAQKLGFWDQEVRIDAVDKQIMSLIKTYPIPNSIDDIVEFFHLALGNINVEKSKKSVFNTDGWEGENRERYLSNAWVGKLQQIYRKAELYFPNTPEFEHIKDAYMDMMKKLKML